MDEKGTVISCHSLTTAGTETVLTAKPEKRVLNPNGQDLSYLPIQFTDQAGCFKPYIEQRVEIERRRRNQSSDTVKEQRVKMRAPRARKENPR